MASATVCTIPVYVALASPERNGTPRNMLIVVTLYLHAGNHLQAQLEWQTVPCEMCFVSHSVSQVRASTPTYVDALYPPDILDNPMYLIVNDPPGYSFPHRLLITIHVTDFNPNDPSSLRVHSDMRYLAPARSVDAGVVRLRPEVGPPPVYAPSPATTTEAPHSPVMEDS